MAPAEGMRTTSWFEQATPAHNLDLNGPVEALHAGC